MTVGLLDRGAAVDRSRWSVPVCAVVAIGAGQRRSAAGDGRVRRRVIGLALAAGALFGIFFALLAQTHDDSGMWPLVAVRCASDPARA